MNNVDYKLDTVPDDYKCGKCGATNCKLWREYNAFPPIGIFCARCATRDQKKSIETLDDTGRRYTEDGMKTDTIGGLVPAVPDKKNVGYWGYTSVPQDGVDWWRRLPTYPAIVPAPAPAPEA